MDVRRRQIRSIVALFRDGIHLEKTVADLQRLGVPSEDLLLSLHNGNHTNGISQNPNGTFRSHRDPKSPAGITGRLGLDNELAQSLEDMGYSRPTAQHYAGSVNAGAVLLAVQCNGRYERVRSALDKNGAFDVRSSER